MPRRRTIKHRWLPAVEELEQRTLLSTISGRVVEDVTGDGVTPDDVGRPGWAVTLEGENTTLLQADFSDEAGGSSLDGFSASGLWHATPSCAGEAAGHTSPDIAYFGLDATCDFDAGIVSGDLSVGPLDIPRDSQAALMFNYRLDGEGGPVYDAAAVQVAMDGGSFVSIATNGDGTIPQTLAWSSLALDLSSYAGHTIQVRFHFDSYDDLANSGLGWQLDDVKITSLPITQATTDASGNYSFTAVEPGSYDLRATDRAGWLQTTPNPPTILVTDPGQEFTGNDFGQFELGKIRGQVFRDGNNNGVHDQDEVGLNGWTIDLFDAASHLIGSAQTADRDLDANGTIDPVGERGVFEFTGLAAGTYTLVQHATDGWVATAATGPVTLSGSVSGEVASGLAFGDFPRREISGRLFEDTDGNGDDNSGTDPGLPGRIVFLDQNGNGQLDAGEVSTSTNAQGGYSFVDIASGSYSVTVQSIPDDDVVTMPSSAGPYRVDVTDGTVETGDDFGLFQLGTISGQAFDDANSNGVKDAGEAAVPGWNVFIDVNENGILDQGEPTSVTDQDGNYTLHDVLPGPQLVRQVPAEGWASAAPPEIGWQITPQGSFDPNLGTPLGISDQDDATQHVSLSFSFPFAGAGYTDLYVSTNGFLSLGSDAGDGCRNASQERLTSGPARIAPFWTDLDPGLAGSVYFNDLGDHAVITWDGVVAAGDDGSHPNTFQVQLSATGEVVLSYGTITLPPSASAEVLIGLSPGQGATVRGTAPLLDGDPINSHGRTTMFDLATPSSLQESGFGNGSIRFALSPSPASETLSLTSGEHRLGMEFPGVALSPSSGGGGSGSPSGSGGGPGSDPGSIPGQSPIIVKLGPGSSDAKNPKVEVSGTCHDVRVRVYNTMPGMPNMPGTEVDPSMFQSVKWDIPQRPDIFRSYFHWQDDRDEALFLIPLTIGGVIPVKKPPAIPPTASIGFCVGPEQRPFSFTADVTLKDNKGNGKSTTWFKGWNQTAKGTLFAPLPDWAKNETGRGFGPFPMARVKANGDLKGPGGQFAFIQLVSIDGTFTLKNGEKWTRNTKGGRVDQGSTDRAFVPMGGEDDPVDFVDRDSCNPMRKDHCNYRDPVFVYFDQFGGKDRLLETASYRFEAGVWVMFSPLVGAAWVPVAKGTWSWSATIRADATKPVGYDWVNRNFSGETAFAPTVEWPTWVYDSGDFKSWAAKVVAP